MKKLIVLPLLVIFAGNVLAGEMKMYWSDIGTWKIQRANLDGSEVEDVFVDIPAPKGLALDMVNNKLYYTESPGGYPLNAKILRSNLDGSAPEALVTGLHIARDVDLDLLNSTMYIGEHGGGDDSLYRANLDGSDFETLISPAVPNDVVLHLRMEKIYWTNGEEVRRSNLDGSDAETVSDDFDWPLGIAIDLLKGKIYVTDSGELKIKRMNLDGTGMETLVTQDSGYLMGISLDTEEEKMYWVNWGDGTIQRANLDGSEAETLVDSGLVFPWYIDLTVEADVDGDGIVISQDLCPETAQERAAFMGLKVNRYADIDNDNTFETRLPSGEIVDSAFDMSNTKGCSCSQILDSLPGNHEGERKFGCTKHTLLGSKNLLRAADRGVWEIELDPVLRADFNADGCVDILDLIELLPCFGLPAVPGCETQDINEDGTVSVLDLIALLLAFGTACP